jgi:S1-C subfamily serine protease
MIAGRFFQCREDYQPPQPRNEASNQLTCLGAVFYSRHMRALLSLLLILTGVSALAGGLPSVTINGNSYSNITKVYIVSSGRVIVMFEGGGTSASVDKVPADFLASWNINADAQSGAKAAASAQAENNLQHAIDAGVFREVEGVVYDTRKTQAGWVSFNSVKVLQITDDGAIIDLTPNSYDDHVAIFVKHLPAVSDTDYITFTALPTGTFSYVNKAGDDRTIRQYDLGRVCERSEIPAAVLAGKLSSADQSRSGEPQTDVVASLPESGDLQASGSGFFISADGYLITNNHVVKNARRVKVKTSAGVFPAEVVRVDETNDLALLKISGQFTPLHIATNEVQLGDAVFTIGFPAIDLQGMQPKYTDGKISSLTGIRDDPREYQISVQVQPGNSGGPLADMAGNVHGVVVARLDDFAALRAMGSLPQNVNYAVKGERLREFLSQSPEVKLRTEESAPNKSAVSDVQQSIALVLVY